MVSISPALSLQHVSRQKRHVDFASTAELRQGVAEHCRGVGFFSVLLSMLSRDDQRAFYSQPAKRRWQRVITAEGQRGFTFIEILVVLIIIALLAAIVSVNVIRARSDANEAFAIQQLNAGARAAEFYAMDNNGRYPAGIDNLTEATPPYLSRNVFDGEAHHGYLFEYLRGNDNSYRVRAFPFRCNQTGKRTFVIRTNVRFEESACVEE